MATYLIVNGLIMISLAILLWVSPVKFSWRIMVGVLAPMLVLTAIFDSLLIHANMYVYNSQKILNIFVGLTPIEDFAYTLVAVPLVVWLWKKWGAET